MADPGRRIDPIHLEDHWWHLLVRHPASGVVITETALSAEVPHDDLKKTALEAVGAVPELLPPAMHENMAGAGSGSGSSPPETDDPTVIRADTTGHRAALSTLIVNSPPFRAQQNYRDGGHAYPNAVATSGWREPGAYFLLALDAPPGRSGRLL